MAQKVNGVVRVALVGSGGISNAHGKGFLAHADKIKVVALCPGYVDTAFVPPNRRVDRSKFLRPDDVADTIFHILTLAAAACPTEITPR